MPWARAFPFHNPIRLQRECPMKKLFNRITEKQARVLTLCLLGAAVVLLGAALWLNLRAGGGGTTLTTYAMGSYIQQTVYGAGPRKPPSRPPPL